MRDRTETVGLAQKSLEKQKNMEGQFGQGRVIQLLKMIKDPWLSPVTQKISQLGHAIVS